MHDAQLDGEDVTFGTSGFLYQNNKLMYDRPTDTLWHSLTGEPVVGELAHSGVKVDRFPVTHTTWERWLELHPDTTVVSLDAGFERQYFPPSEPGSAYYEYRASTEAMFPVFSVDDWLPEKDMVVGIASETGKATAFPVEQVVAERVINTAVGAGSLESPPGSCSGSPGSPFSPVPRFIPAGRHAAAFFRKQVYLYQLN